MLCKNYTRVKSREGSSAVSKEKGGGGGLWGGVGRQRNRGCEHANISANSDCYCKHEEGEEVV